MGSSETDEDHCDVRVLVNEVANIAHLRFKIRGPYVPYSSHDGERVRFLSR